MTQPVVNGTAPTPVVDKFPWETDEAKRYPPKEVDKFNEFEQKYPVDPIGAELDENARVWKVYKDRANEIDNDTVSEWNDAINFLLVFAGLFAAVMTAFLIEITKQLQPDYTQYNAMATYALLAHANGSSIPPREQVDPTLFQASGSARTTNVLWYLSLTLALTASLLAILAKQWIMFFVVRMRSPVASAQRWAWRHWMFRRGMEKWHLNAYISILSMLLHASLLIFLAGLIFYLSSIDRAVFGIVLGVSLFAFFVYMTATLLPCLYGECPTVTPLLLHGDKLIRNLFRLSHSPRFHQDEVMRDKKCNGLNVLILDWMIRTLAAGHDVDCALDALGALDKQNLTLSPDALHIARVRARGRIKRLLEKQQTRKLEPLEVNHALRTSLVLEDGESSRSMPIQTSELDSFNKIPTNDVFFLAAALKTKLWAFQVPASPNVSSFLSPMVTWCTNKASAIPAHATSRAAVLHNLQQLSQQNAQALTVPECAMIIVCFGREAFLTTHEITIPVIKASIGLGFPDRDRLIDPSDRDLEALQGWAFILSHPLAWPWTKVLWSCYDLTLRQCRPKYPPSTLQHVERLLSPLEGPRNFGVFISAASVDISMAMLMRVASSTRSYTPYWSHRLGDIVAHLLVLIERDTTQRDVPVRVAGALKLFQAICLLYSTNEHRSSVAGVDSDRVKASTPLNLLVTRVVFDKAGTSPWAILCRLPYAKHRDLVLCARYLLSELAKVSDRPDEVGSMLHELLGDDRGVKIICGSPYMSRELAVQAKLLSESWWTETCDKLRQTLPDKWDPSKLSSLTGPEAFILDVAPPSISPPAPIDEPGTSAARLAGSLGLHLLGGSSL
ncbi:hypothetical protein BKA62DRAFT_769517 [Auriculariales sp. MPI-PUGE-AT-0066]|nr:hypothetical protein BKA62DRAFT_769517 [Auriculariales sp. MPI-PUGE-AT-0066]